MSVGVGRGFRAEIQALRALAVIAVVVYHLWPNRLPGGYVGVDVFFVISGYLITSHLVREVEATGTLRFGRFWARRARRLLPAALAVLTVTIAAVVLLVPFGFWGQFFREIAGSIFYVENWVLASDAVNYLAADQGTSPVQHYWSLSVEEQFYLLWPLLIVAAAILARRLGNLDRRTALFVMLACLVVASFAFSVWQTSSDPSIAYFSTFTRAWEFGAGALLAMLPLRWFLTGVRASTAASLGGLVTIAASMFLLDDHTPFPGIAAILPVAGAALIIWAGTPTGPIGWVVRLAPVQFVGRISYSLYLWHWPGIAIAAILIGGDLPQWLRFTLLLFSVAMAWVSVALIEDPVRNSGLSEAPARHSLGLAIAAMVAAAVLLVPPWVTVNIASTASARTAPAFATESDLTSALASPSSIAPGMLLGQGSGPVSEWVSDGCLNVDDDSQERCTYGSPSAPRTALLLGDSIAVSWLPALRGALDPAEWQIKVLTMGQCPVSNVSITRLDGNTSFTKACDDHREWAMTVAESVKPDLVLVSQSANSWRHLASGADGDEAIIEWRAGLASAFDRVSEMGVATVVLERPEFGQRRAAECVGLLLHVAKCVGEYANPSDFSDYERQEAVKAGLHWLASRPWVCTESNACPAVVDGTAVTADGSHLSAEYSSRLTLVLRTALVGALGDEHLSATP